MANVKDDRGQSVPSSTDECWEVVFEHADDAPRKRRLTDDQRGVLARVIREAPGSITAPSVVLPALK